MGVVHNEEKVNQFIREKNYEDLWSYMSSAKETEYEDWSKEQKTIYWLSFLERNLFRDKGIHGLLEYVTTTSEAIMLLDGLKKHLQRMEWWPEYEPAEVLAYMHEYHITADEMVYLMKAVTLHPDYVLGRLNGSVSPKDFYERSQKEIEDLISRSDHSGKKLCFITCSNNEAELNEMNLWIDRLWIPEGMEVDRLEVWEATSMCAGYNEAMNASDADYKVYLHQDVRILNPFFIFDLLEAFNKNPRAGMVGLFGAVDVPETGVMWHTSRYGDVIHTEFKRDRIYETYEEKVEYPGDFPAKLIDGFLMATKTDIAWREDVFKKWDFYDASQSMEFLDRGYEIIVPRQGTAWCLHDFGQLDYTNYDHERQIFVETYLSTKT